MKKASAMITNHTGLLIHTLLRDFLIFSVFICVALFIWLKVGIKVESLIVGKYKVEELYIKLDKKLTLTADNILIPKSKAKPSFENIDKTFDMIKQLFTFFKYIELKNITFDNNHLKVIFTDDTLYVSSDDYEIAGKIHRKDTQFIAEVSLLHLKKNNIDINGTLNYHLDTDILETEGAFSAYNIKGDFKALRADETIDFKIDSDAFTDLKTLIHSFKLKENLQTWITDKVQAKNYKLTTLEGKIVVHSENNITVDYEALKGNVILNNIKIFYKKGLAPILAKSAEIVWEDKTLNFDLKEASYLGRKIQGNQVKMTGLVDKTTSLKLDFNITTPIDKEVQKILKAYRLDIPLAHKGKDAKLHLKMRIPLDENYPEEEKMTTSVKVNVESGILKYNNIVLPVKKANIEYDSEEKKGVLFNTVLKKGIITIGKAKFPVLAGKLKYENELIILKNIHMKEPWYEGRLSGNVNTKIQKTNLKLNAKKITIGGKDKILLLKNKQLPFSIDYSKKLKINVPSLALKIEEKKKGFLIKIDKVEKLKPYLQNIPLDITGGYLSIRSSKTDTYTFKGELKRKDCFLYDKNATCHTRIPVHGKVSKNKLDFYAFSKRVHFNLKKSRLEIKNLNIDLEKFLKSKKRDKKGKSNKLVILGKKSNIRYKKHVLVTDSYDMEIQPNGNIKAFGSSGGNIVKLSKKGKKFSLKALRVTDKTLHPLINFKGLKEGRYSLKISGNPDKVMKGQIIVEGGVISDFKAYNNTLAFINALPAIATLSNPGFSEKGFKIQEGVVDYHKVGDKITFDSIYLKGSAATIAGKGTLDLKHKTIKMDLAIQTARELGKFVGNLPLVGYILLGKDKSMTIGLKISGSLDKPVVSTTTAQDILTLPLRLIKRTLESPAHIMNQ